MKITLIEPQPKLRVKDLENMTVFQRGIEGTISLKVDRGSLTLNINAFFVHDADRGMDLVGVVHGRLKVEAD